MTPAIKQNSPEYIYKKVWYWVAAVILSIIIIGSLWPFPPKILHAFHLADKVFHLLAYFILTIWYMQLSFSYRVRLTWALTFIVLGVVLEYLQGLTGYRLFDIYDAIANGLGVLFGFFLGFTRLGSMLQSVDSYLLATVSKRHEPG